MNTNKIKYCFQIIMFFLGTFVVSAESIDNFFTFDSFESNYELVELIENSSNQTLLNDNSIIQKLTHPKPKKNRNIPFFSFQIEDDIDLQDSHIDLGEIENGVSFKQIYNSLLRVHNNTILKLKVINPPKITLRI